MTDTGEILIAGAGPGGLTAALSLHAAGFAVRVFEAAAVIQPLGVGLNLLPHAVRELDELGLRPDLEKRGVACRQLSYFTKRGELIWSEPRGVAAGYNWPQISIHRGGLQSLLLDRVVSAIGEDRLHLGHELRQVLDRDGRGVRVRFLDRTTDTETDVRGRLLIACDGIHSAVRRALYPDEGLPRWNGAIMWRGVADHAPVLDGRTMIMAGHPRVKFVCYPISDRTATPGQQVINFIAELRTDASALSEREDWSKPGNLNDFLPAFESFRFDWLDVPGLIRSANAVWIYPMVDRDPLPRWTHGSLTLLGDAAHPMYPIGSNGASQAILDARVLTGCLRQYRDNLERGLERYDDIRRPATTRIVLANRGQGPELPMQLVEERAPDGFRHLDDVIPADELRTIAEKYKQLAGFSVDELNTRRSLAEPIA